MSAVQALGCGDLPPPCFSTVDSNEEPLGLFRSGDSGSSWQLVGQRLGSITALAYDPSQPTTVYAGGSRLYRTADDGETWERLSGYPANTGVQALAVDPTDPNVVFAGSRDRGVLRSADAGLSWRPANNGIELGTPIAKLAIDPSNSSHIYAVTGTGFGGQLLESEDAGVSWSSLPDLPDKNAEIVDIAIMPGQPSVILATWYAGLFRSTDGGASWTRVLARPVRSMA